MAGGGAVAEGAAKAGCTAWSTTAGAGVVPAIAGTCIWALQLGQAMRVPTVKPATEHCLLQVPH